MKLYEITALDYNLRQNNPSTEHLRSWEKRIIKKHAKGHMLDIGSGTGYHLDFLEILGIKAIGIDISKEMIKQSNLNGIRSDAANLPFPDNSFDTIICMFSTLNLMNNSAFSEIARVLKKDGIFIASFSSIWDKKCPNFFEKLKTKNIPSHLKRKTVHISKNILHFNLFTKEDAKKLENKGLCIKEFYGLFIYQRPYWGRFEKFNIPSRIKLLMDNLQLFPDLGTMYIVVFFKK